MTAIGAKSRAHCYGCRRAHSANLYVPCQPGPSIVAKNAQVTPVRQRIGIGNGDKPSFLRSNPEGVLAMKTVNDRSGNGPSRRRFLNNTSALAAASFLGLPRMATAEPPPEIQRVRLS